MPLYSYKCDCGKTRDVLLTVKEMEKPTKAVKYELTCDCGKLMHQYFSSAPGIRTDTKNRY